MELYTITKAQAPEVPIIISVPHAGTGIPEELKNHYDPRLSAILDDTDWFVDWLYDFAPSLGITLIKANLSRWVIDLNRDPKSIPLYNDDRLITTITPLTDFYGNSIYTSKDVEPDTAEINRRLETYYWPYYFTITELLEKRKATFGKVLLWDAHSIRHKVSTIQADPFPDMILGNNNEKTAAPALISAALNGLQTGSFQVNHNSPFKGGHITRYFGKPENNVHGLQLEMNKILYMDDNELTYNTKRAAQIKSVLQTTLKNLIDTLH